MASLQRDRKKRVSGKFCVAGGPGNISCNNTSLTKDISMHTFPSDDILKRKWTQFVQKHRPGFKPSQTSVLCSVHFDKHCFTRRLDLLDPENVSVEISKNTRLVNGSVPTIDTARQIKKQTDTQDLLTVRDKRMIMRKVLEPASMPSTATGHMNSACKSTDDTNPTTNDVSMSSSNSLVNMDATTSVPDTDSTTDIVMEEIISNQPSAGNNQKDSLSTPILCEKCSKKSLAIRRLQKNNSYLRRTAQNLREHLNLSCNGDSTETTEDESDSTETTEDESESTCHDHDDYLSQKEDTASELGSCTEEECRTDNEDPEWNFEEEFIEGPDDDDEDNEDPCIDTKNTVRVEPGIPAHEEPKFMVFYTMLLNLFTMFCFQCKSDYEEKWDNDYVSAIKEVMLNHSAKEHLKMLKKYQAKIPDPLNRQFDDRVSKAEAICLKYERNKLKTELFPAVNKRRPDVPNDDDKVMHVFPCVAMGKYTCCHLPCKVSVKENHGCNSSTIKSQQMDNWIHFLTASVLKGTIQIVKGDNPSSSCSSDSSLDSSVSAKAASLHYGRSGWRWTFGTHVITGTHLFQQLKYLSKIGQIVSNVV
ncbi:THAP domain-containing 2-like, partial [Paramuricea clavata]